jgi:hypothetical protein
LHARLRRRSVRRGKVLRAGFAAAQDDKPSYFLSEHKTNIGGREKAKKNLSGGGSRKILRKNDFLLDKAQRRDVHRKRFR